MPPPRGRRQTWLFALLLATAVMWLTGGIPRWGQWYASHPYYRAQVAAFLDGKLALSDQPEALAHDLAWIDGGVQQVWGLGVPAWETPFEVVGRLIHVTPFPDRLAMLAGMILVLYLLLRAWLGRTGDRTLASRGAFIMCAFAPGVIAMMKGRLGVYEEASAYAYGAAMILLAGTLLMIRRPTRGVLLVLAAFAGLSALVRPTVICYGAASLGVASLVYLQRNGIRRGIATVLLASALFGAGGGVLYLTNKARFGKGTEFGHRLNLEDLPANMYSTRFDYPFEHARLGDAAKELVGGIFGRPEIKARSAGAFFWDDHLHRWQLEMPRCREYYFTTNTWSQLPLILAGILLCVLAWVRVRRPIPKREPTMPIVGAELERETRWLGLWAILGMTPLVVYYLRAPCVSSRYFLDLAPAFIVLMVLVWRTLATAAPAYVARIVFYALVIWWLFSSANYRSTRNWLSPARAKGAVKELTTLTMPESSLESVPAVYELTDPELPVYIGGRQLTCDCFFDLDEKLVCDHIGYPNATGYVTYNSVEDPVATVKVTEDMLAQCAVDGEIPDACSPDNPDGELPLVHDQEPFSWLDERNTLGALYRNGTEWDLNTGNIGVSTFFFVDAPQYLEVEVGPADGHEPGPAWVPEIRAKIQLDELHVVGMESTARGVRVRFSGPTTKRYQTGLQVAFIAFGPPEAIGDALSDYKLYRVAWRDR